MPGDIPESEAERAAGWRSTNFEFLRAEFPQLASYGAFAEMYLDDDADSAGVKLRRFVEAVVDIVYARKQLPVPAYNDLASRIQARGFRTAVGDVKALSDMDRIRREPGKAGAHHGYAVSKETALEGLRAAHRLGIWFIKAFGNSPVTVPPFVRPQPGGARAGKNRELKERIKEGKEAFGRLVAELSVLTPASVVDLVPSAAAEEELALYRTGLMSMLQQKTATYWLPDGNTEFRIELDGLADNGGRLSLVGGGGSGKSWQVRRAAMDAGARSTVIYAEAKYFSGDVDRWLDAAIWAFSPVGAARVARLTRQLGRQLVVVIDGLDELALEHRSKLHEVAEALVHRRAAVVVLVGRDAAQLPQAWAEAAVLCQLWRPEQLATLSRGLTDADLPEQVLAALRTPQDAALAANAARLLNSELPSAIDLFRAYVRASCASEESYIGALILGRSLEELMRAELRTALAEEQVTRSLEVVAEQRGIRTTVLADFLKAPFIELSQGSISFAHTNFQAFFRAESILRQQPSDEQLAAVAHEDADSAQLLLPMLSEPRTVRAVLTGLGVSVGLSGGGRFRQDAVLDALGDKYGAVVHSMVATDLASLFERELHRVRSVRFSAPIDATENLELTPFAFETELNEYDRSLFAHLALEAPYAPLLRRKVIQLLDDTLERATDAACATLGAAEAHAKRERVRAILLWRLLTLGGSVTGAGMLCSVSPFSRRMTEPETCDLLRCADDGGLGSFYWALRTMKTVGAQCAAVQSALPHLLRRAKASVSSQVIYEALELVRSFGRHASGPVRDEIRVVLNSFESGRDVFVGNLVLEGLDALGEDLGFSVESINQRIASVIESRDEDEACAEAAELYGWQYEAIGAEAHFRAIDALAGAARTRFLAMAALGSTEASVGLVQLLSQLAQCADAGADPFAVSAFRKWAVAVSSSGPVFHTHLSWVVVANAALAWLGYEPLAPVGPQSSESEVAFLVAELVFLSARGGSRSSRCETIWRRLEALATVSADTVCRLAAAQFYDDKPFVQRLPSLTVDFAVELREFLHVALRHHAALVSPIPGYSVSREAVALLGSIGNADSRRLLLGLRDTESLGEVARAAARKIP